MDQTLKEKLLIDIKNLINVGTNLKRNNNSNKLNFFEVSGFASWRLQVVALISTLQAVDILGHELQAMQKLQNTEHARNYGIGILNGVAELIKNDYLLDVYTKVNNHITDNLLSFAESMMPDNTKDNSHIAPTILACAILERHLKNICTSKNPPISIINEKNDKQVTLDPLINILVKEDIITSTDAKELRFLAGIRNDAAHGDFEKVSIDHAKQVLGSVQKFIDTLK